MPMREDAIRSAIQNLPGDLFERFARELLRRELYPGLNPTSSSHDLGEDARTERSTVFLHEGLWVSVIASKTARWSKIEKDCRRCKETKRHIDVVVFATAGNPRTDTQEKWRGKVEEKFGWTLECRTLPWFAAVASAPQHESLVDDYLCIPPPGGDFVQAIEREFSYHTDQALKQIRLLIPGIANPLPRREIPWIEDQLQQGKAVILTGDAGTGKSVIGAKLVCSARERGNAILLIDARRVGYVRSESELRQHLALSGPVHTAIDRIGRFKGCRLIIDQLDNVAGSIAAKLLVELAIACSNLEAVEVVVISRKREAHEVRLLERLITTGFAELTSYPLSEKRVAEVLDQLGIPQPSADLIALGRNLLNLELIGTIKQKQPDFDFFALMDEVDLWERYIQVLLEREEAAASPESAGKVVAEAVRLARVGLNSEDRTFCLDFPLSHPHRRLISWEIIVCDDGRICHFRHEKLQDFLYAWDATQRHAMPSTVLSELNIHRTRGVLVWMDRIYSRQDTQLHRQFLKEALDVQ